MVNFKNYCWVIGTTSFRMVEFNKKIEKQLDLLDNFWNDPNRIEEKWENNIDIQEKYYDYILGENFIVGEAPRKDKDAREKTSGLVEMGLINSNRRLTQVGRKLLNLSKSGKFDNNNILQISSDSMIYLKQFIKLTYSDEGKIVRPYVLLCYLLYKFKEISDEEFTYLIPLITSGEKLQWISDDLVKIRNGTKTVDETILDVLKNMSNYQEAHDIFISAPTVDEELIMEIGINRKSRSYDKSYFQLFDSIKKCNLILNDENIKLLFDSIDKLNLGPKKFWRKYFFKKTTKNAINKNASNYLLKTELIDKLDEKEIREKFFWTMHLFKVKATLNDYSDLNKRYFKTTNTIIFQDEKVKLDIIPNCYFSIIGENLLNESFKNTKPIDMDIELKEIDPIFDIRQETILKKIEEIYGIKVHNSSEAKIFVDKDRCERFDKLLETKFNNDTIIELMTLFEKREDKKIQSLVTTNADIPTIFEYIVAIAWYKISENKGNILSFMNLSLDSDLLPLSHAAGGHEDLTFKYTSNPEYPSHSLLIEATLSFGDNQRRMEMEPVSRHLGDYILKHEDDEAYCLFVSTTLHINVISDFRSRKTYTYYADNGKDSVTGMKIIPLATNEIKTILSNKMTYGQLFNIFEEAYKNDSKPNVWYNDNIVLKIKQNNQ